jgi:hypothetical protein
MGPKPKKAGSPTRSKSPRKQDKDNKDDSAFFQAPLNEVDIFFFDFFMSAFPNYNSFPHKNKGKLEIAYRFCCTFKFL